MLKNAGIVPITTELLIGDPSDEIYVKAYRQNVIHKTIVVKSLSSLREMVVDFLMSYSYL